VSAVDVLPTDPAIATVRAGDEVRGIYACTRKDRLLGRSGAPCLALELRDRTAAIAARVFRDADLQAGRFENALDASVKGALEHGLPTA
jgi:3'-5' exoribonuclease